MTEIVYTLLSLASILMLLVFAFIVYQDLAVDRFRQKMFTLRDRMFDEAASGKFDFNHPAYGMLRSTMNGLIRFGHRLNLPVAFALSVALSRHFQEQDRLPFSERLHRHLDTLDEDQRNILSDYYREMNMLLSEHLILGSPILVATLVPPVAIWLQANKLLKMVGQVFSNSIDKIDSVAFSEGESSRASHVWNKHSGPSAYAG